MKLRKLLSITLALLLVLSLLPVGALADTVPDNYTEHADNSVGHGDTMNNNYATISINQGTITNNGGADGSAPSALVYQNDGTIVNNYAGVGENNVTIETNKGTVGIEDADGNVVDISGNFGTVETNEGKVLINQKDGTVETNTLTGTIETNKGTVGKKGEDGNVVGGSGNNGVIRVNEGHVLTNNFDGIVITNTKDGTIDTNNGFVGARNDANEPLFNSGTGNFGFIDVNNGKITINGENATVDTNNFVVYENNGDIGTNNGGVEYNYGDIVTNNGSVYENDGDIDTNNFLVEFNYGGIDTNSYEVWYNYGTVETNTIYGIVWNETDTNGVTGEVKTNYGTMLTPTEDDGGVDGVNYKVQYGVQVQNTDGGTGNTLLQAVKNTILELAELFQRDGYELVGYEDVTPTSIEEYPDDIPAEFSLPSEPDPDTDTPELSATDFQAKRPSILSLIWKAITKPSGGSDGGAEPTSSGNTGRISPPVLSSLSADKVSVGALIRCGKVIFKIIEVNDDSIRVATVETLSKQNQEDMMGYLKQYLSAAQIAKFIGEPELLDADEIAQFFKDNRAHIAFYAAKDLFEA